MRNMYKNMPLFSVDYLVTPFFYGNKVRDWVEMFLLGGFLEAACRTISGTAQDWTSLNPMNNVLVLPIAIPLMRALYLAANMLYNRKDVIWERNMAIDKNVAHISGPVTEFSKARSIVEYNSKSPFYDISVSLLKNRVADNSQYFFDEVLKSVQKSTRDSYMTRFEEIVLKTHLKKHPQDINRVLEVFGKGILPKSIQKYIGR